MIRTQRHSRFVLMSLDEIRATRDIVLQTEETKSNFSGSGKTVYICEVVRPCDYQKETDTAADKLAAAGADKEAFVPIVLDLTSDDGLDDYGTDSAKIGLITDQMYRAFRKIIPKASEDYWTCTPFSTERNGYKSFVRSVYTSGALNYSLAYFGAGGVRPLCALKSDILVSYDEGEVNERKPSFGEMIGKALAEGLNKAIFGEGEEPKGILAEAEAQAAHEKEQEDEDQKRADAVDMMKHIAAAFDIPATIGEGKQEEQEKEAKQLFGWYSELKKAGFTDAQAFELIKG